jgi:flagellin
MISGLNNLSVAAAIRSAATARATMDTMSRQIATGQRVSSVKDDGAAWTRANVLRGTADVNRVAAEWASRANMLNEAGMAGQELILEKLQRMRDLAVSAIGVANGPSNRTPYQVEYAGLLADLNTTFSVNSIDGANTAWFGTTPSSETYSAAWIARDPSGTGDFIDDAGMSLAHGSTIISTSNLATDSAASLTALVTNLNTMIQNSYRVSANSSAAFAATSRMQERAGDRADRAELAAATLTEADLGRASSSLRQAETRQQLAVQTVRTAISAYGNLASGLLGNVQRTQRAIA